MTKEEFDHAKNKMKEYRDIFGSELNRKYLIDNAENIFDLENILNMHCDHISDMANDAQSSLSRFKRDLGIF